MSIIVKTVDQINKYLLYIIAVILIIMSLTIFSQVFSRFFLGASLSWSEELSRYLMAWLVFLGAAISIRKQSLIGVEAFVDLVSNNVKKYIKTFVYIVCLGFGVFLVLKGIDMLEIVATQKSPAMKVPMTWVYASIPFGGVLMAINSIVVIIELHRKD